MWDVVIIGGGAAGWAAVQKLRALDANVSIAMVTGCSGDVYAKPELSIALSRGVSEEKLCKGRGRDVAHSYNVRILDDTFAVGIDPDRQRLRTTRGTLKFRTLIFAQGAQPIVLPSMPESLVWRINNLTAWSRLKTYIGSDIKRIVVVGAGLVGCELAEDAARSGHNVTLLGRGTHPMDSLLPFKCGSLLANRLRESGMVVRNEANVINVHRVGENLVVKLADGSEIETDIVISAVGLVTDLRLARMANLETDCAIKVDPVKLQTSRSNIYALGDCVSINGKTSRYLGPIPSQAEAIAHAILGFEHDGYNHETPIIRLKSKVAPIEIRGMPEPEGQWEIVEESLAHLSMQQRNCGIVTASLKV
nr:FAD-dependent oxidoreductase [Acetobacter thailandicus]